MNDNAVASEFNAASDRFLKELKEDKADDMLSALRDAAQAMTESGAQVSLEVRPRLQGVTGAQTGRVYANAVLTVDDVVTNWIVSYERIVRNGRYVHATTLAGSTANDEVARFTAECTEYSKSAEWSAPELRGKKTLKDALIAVISQARAEHEMLSRYNVGFQPASLQKPFVAGLKPRAFDKP